VSVTALISARPCCRVRIIHSPLVGDMSSDFLTNA
jgi:hypothetical protein